VKPEPLKPSEQERLPEAAAPEARMGADQFDPPFPVGRVLIFLSADRAHAEGRKCTIWSDGDQIQVGTIVRVAHQGEPFVAS